MEQFLDNTDSHLDTESVKGNAFIFSLLKQEKKTSKVKVLVFFFPFQELAVLLLVCLHHPLHHQCGGQPGSVLQDIAPKSRSFFVLVKPSQKFLTYFLFP